MAKNDELIKELLAKVEEQTAALGKAPKIAWHTNGVFKFTKDNYFNINVETIEDKFAHALGMLLRNKEYFERARERLGITDLTFTFLHEGYLVEEWEADFKLRISVLRYNDRKKVLEATKTKLNSLVSEKARTEMALSEISKVLETKK